MEAGISKEVQEILSDPKATSELYKAAWGRREATIDVDKTSYTISKGTGNTLKISKGSRTKE